MEWAHSLDWLVSFDSDLGRVAAIGLLSLAAVVVAVGRPFMETWRQDRERKRFYELQNKEAAGQD